LLFSDAEEDLESVDFFLVDFGNDAGQDKAEEDEKSNASDKHDNLGFHIVCDKLKDLCLPLINFSIHIIPGDISIKFKIINFELLN
jgi:hypothetical protein